MHIEILIEDSSGKVLLDSIIEKMVDLKAHSCRITSYKGIGRLPKGLKPGTDASKRLLLNQLPRILNGLGKTFRGYGKKNAACVVVVCDLDRKNKDSFLSELKAVLEKCACPPNTDFCLAVEEGEAWILGDQVALKTAYPDVKMEVLLSYKQDSICGTWEKLADIIEPGGARKLEELGYAVIGAAKARWAQKIGPLMVPERNRSPSFASFRGTLTRLTTPQDQAVP